MDPHTPSYILPSEHSSSSLGIPGVDTLPELFQWQSQQRGDATFLSFQQNDHLTTLSYSEAYSRSSSLAQALSQCLPATPSNPVVGIWIERSISLHLAIAATTICGASWLPYDADAPTERVTACLQDSNASILLCDEAHKGAATQAVQALDHCQVVTFEQLSSQSKQAINAPTNRSGPLPEDTAYIIYTSGSSGTPKGIAISHHAALTFALSERSILGTGPDDIVWQGFSAAFDMFIEET